MPASKRRGTYRRRAPRAKRWKGTRTVKRRVAKLERVTRAEVRVVDQLYNDNNYVVNALNGASVTSSLNYIWAGVRFPTLAGDYNVINSGVGQGDIIGNKIFMKRVIIRWCCYLDQTLGNNDYSNQIRLLTFWDTQATTAAGQQMLTATTQPLGAIDGSTSSTATVATILTGHNPMMTGPGKRFRPLRDFQFTISAAGKNEVSGVIDMKIDKEVTVNSPVGTGSQLNQNVLFCFISDSLAAGHPVITWQTRIVFTTQ